MEGANMKYVNLEGSHMAGKNNEQFILNSTI